MAVTYVNKMGGGGGHSIPGTLPASPDYMELVPATEYISDCRTPPRGGEHYHGQRVQEYEGPLQLNGESSGKYRH